MDKDEVIARLRQPAALRGVLDGDPEFTTEQARRYAAVIAGRNKRLGITEVAVKPEAMLRGKTLSLTKILNPEAVAELVKVVKAKHPNVRQVFLMIPSGRPRGRPRKGTK